MATEKEYQEAIALLVLGDAGQIDCGDGENHYFEFVEDGDGWNEPYSDSGGCACGWDGMGWIQTNPRCTGRKDIWEYVLEWVKHINEDVWKVDHGDIPQDSDFVQEESGRSGKGQNDFGLLDDS